MKLPEIKIRLSQIIGDLSELLEGIDGADDGPGVSPAYPRPRFVEWAGVIGKEPEVLDCYPLNDDATFTSVFPEGVYRFNLEVTPPEHLLGAKKDFRVLLIDIVDQGRGLDPERQFHVECGEKQSGLFFGGHQLRGGDGWPGKGISTRIASHGLALDGSYVVDVPMPFRLVLGEFVVPDPKARKTSPEGTRYKIEMVRES